MEKSFVKLETLPIYVLYSFNDQQQVSQCIIHNSFITNTFRMAWSLARIRRSAKTHCSMEEEEADVISATTHICRNFRTPF